MSKEMGEGANDGQQFIPAAQGNPNKGKGTYGKNPTAATHKRYDPATNTTRSFSKPKPGKVGQGKGLNGKGHDGKFGAPDGGPGRDGRVGGTGPAPQGDFQDSGTGTPAQGMAPAGGKVGQGLKLNGKGHSGQSGLKVGNPRVK